MKRLLRRRFVVALGAILVLMTAGGAAFSLRGSSATQYRTQPAVLSTVTQTMALSGNLTPVGETDLDFATAGRVAAVNVQLGQAVKSGDILATLDPSQLQATLAQAQATLQSAQAKLSLDQAGPTPQTLAQAQGSVTSAQVGLANAQTAYNDSVVVNQQSITQAQASVGGAQSTVTADQNVLNADSATLQRDQARESSDCAQNASTCSADQQAVATDTQKVAGDQQTLTRDQAALVTAQNALAAAVTKSQQGNDQARAQLATAQVQLQNAQAALTAQQQGSTPQQIQMDQNQVQIAQVGVDNAQRSVNQATLTAPVDGLVAQLNLSAGSSVGTGSTNSSATSTTHQIILVTPGAFQVTGTVSDSQVGQIAVGQRARVTAAGTTSAVTGQVTLVAPQATITSGVATFAVTVTLDGTNTALRAGMSASITIVLNQAVHVLTVPLSAIHGTVDSATVEVLINGAPQTRAVQVGATDSQRAQILSGLNPGDNVVIATVSGSVPTPSSNRTGNALGVPGGGGGFRGGAGGRTGG